MREVVAIEAAILLTRQSKSFPRAHAPWAEGNPWLSGCSLSLFHRPFDFAAGFAALDGLPSVMLLLAFGQPELDLCKASLGEINAERDEREPLLLRLAKEFIDLLTVEEQFPRTEWLVIHDVAVAVGTDVAVVKKGLAVLYAGITILEVHPPISQGFDLRTLKHDARLKFLFNEIVVVGLAIRGHRFLETVLLFPHQASDFHVQRSIVVRTLSGYPAGC